MSELSAPGAIVRRHDPDRFLTALFAPPARRDLLLLLYAFNHELERAREVASLAPIALIRLQWWREVVEGVERRHEVASPLGAAIRAGAISPADLLQMIEARETEAEVGLASIAAWRDFVCGTGGTLAVAAGRLLGAQWPEALRASGAAYGAARLLRGIATAASHGRCFLPDDVLAEHGLTPEGVVAAPLSAGVLAARQRLAGVGRVWLAAALRAPVPRDALAAALPVVFALGDLRPGQQAGRPRSVGDRLAVSWAGLTGRLPRGWPADLGDRPGREA
jgi:phytoene synthase